MRGLVTLRCIVKRSSRVLLLATMASLGPLAACDSTDSVAPSAPLANVVSAALDTALNDEYHAETIYLRVLADFGNVLPFFNVVVAEQRHSASVRAIFERHGLTAPANRWDLNTVPTFASVAAACAAAYDAEVANIALYDRLLARDLPNDVRNVFTNNRAASVNNHQPAFLRCR